MCINQKITDKWLEVRSVHPVSGTCFYSVQLAKYWIKKKKTQKPSYVVQIVWAQVAQQTLPEQPKIQFWTYRLKCQESPRGERGKSFFGLCIYC